MTIIAICRETRRHEPRRSNCWALVRPIYRLLVEVLGGVHVTNVRIAVDHCPLEPELRDGALQFVASGAHVLKRHGGEGGEPVRMCRQELLGQIIVHPLCGFDRYRAIRYALNARLRQ